MLVTDIEQLADFGSVEVCSGKCADFIRGRSQAFNDFCSWRSSLHESPCPYYPLRDKRDYHALSEGRGHQILGIRRPGRCQDTRRSGTGSHFTCRVTTAGPPRVQVFSSMTTVLQASLAGRSLRESNSPKCAS